MDDDWEDEETSDNLEDLELEGDSESFDEQDAFYSTTKRPVCYLCKQAIEEFKDLTQCQICLKESHEHCFAVNGCDSCTTDD